MSRIGGSGGKRHRSDRMLSWRLISGRLLPTILFKRGHHWLAKMTAKSPFRKEGIVNAKQLQSWVDEPETHRKVVGEYEGSYALGVTDDPPALVLRVEPSDVSAFPTQVTLHGVDVPVKIQGEFKAPEPQPADGR